MEKQLKKNKYSKAMIIPIALGLILLILFKSAESRLEQIMIGSIFIMILIPFVLKLVSMLLLSSLPKGNKPIYAEDIIEGYNNKSNEIKPNKETTDSIKTHYNVKTNNNPIYIDLRERLIEVVKAGSLNRDDIFKFRLELDNRLGANRYSYTNFTFENEMHEIYIKMKSSKLNDDDYIYLKGLLEDLLS